MPKDPEQRKPRAERPTRWRKDQRRIGNLASSAGCQEAAHAEAEQENSRLKIKAAAMEHVLFAREKQISILSSFRRLCGEKAVGSAAGAPPPPTAGREAREAWELHDAATAPVSILVRMITVFPKLPTTGRRWCRSFCLGNPGVRCVRGLGHLQ